MLSVFQLGRFVSLFKIAGTREIGGFHILRRSAKYTPRPNLKAACNPSRRLRRKSSFSIRVVKFLNRLRTSTVTDPSANSFKDQLEPAWEELHAEVPGFSRPYIPPPQFHNPILHYPCLCYPHPNSLSFIIIPTFKMFCTILPHLYVIIEALVVHCTIKH